MAGVFRNVEIDWRGETYSVKPTMQLLNSIEQQFSLSLVCHRMARGDAPISHIASILGAFLRDAGAEVKDEEVYQELMSSDVEAVQALSSAVMLAVFPQQPNSGKGAAPSKAKKAK